MFNPEAFVKYKDLPNLSTLVRRGATNQFDVPITINGLTIKTNGFIVGVPKVVGFNYAKVGNVGSGLDTLHSFTLAANGLPGNGDELECDLAGFAANNTNTKRLVISVGGTTILDTSLLDFEAFGWISRLLIGRIDATHINVALGHIEGQILVNTTPALIGTSPGSMLSRNSDNLVVSNLGSNTLTVLVQGEATANDDICQNYSRFRVTQMS